ncbi:TonB-dependent receptor [Povalibacter sp.]|uniref:TonB-dependent receptor n=1 Tax=Povalibacter sp. TaxID=1962978 RepID=UPI002F41E5CB
MTTRICVPATTSLVVACALLQAAAAEDTAPTRTLGTVTVVGTRPTSLPTQIPTTIEGITGADIADTINATDAQDALKYLPSLVVRKRYIGDYDHAVLASRASGTNNSARSLVYADGILLSNLLGNGATFTPRWGMVTPEEIERVDVLYGPFSAAYPGNSVGAVVDYVTRMPTQVEAHAKITSFGEDFSVYGSDGRYTGWQASASVGDRTGNWSWWLNYNRLDSDGHPIVFANKLVSAGIPGSAGTPVTGAIADRNPRNQDWLILGATSQVHTVQDHAKAKLAYDFSPTLRLSYTFGWWRNEADRNAETYLHDASGDPIYSGPINVDGRTYTLAPTDISISRGDLQHLMHGIALKSDTRGTWDWEVAASLYDYARDEVRSPLGALPAAASGGAGRITDQDGTGWNAIALKGTWRPGGVAGNHVIDVGYQRDAHKLRTLVSNTDDWLSGAAMTRFSAFQGDTRLQSLYAQDTWRFATDWRATLGLRFEEWQASNGSISNAQDTLPFAKRAETHVSPKAAIAWQVSPDWALKASLGRAVRNPTVAELYQGSIATNAIVNNDPDLEPEKSWTGELTAERAFDRGLLRMTFFHEDTRDALYSQTNVTGTTSVTTIQNVEHIRTSGGEVAWQMRDVVIEGLDLLSSLTYAHSRIVENENFPDSEGKWQPRVPEWRGNLLATYRSGDRWTTSLGARYSGRQYNTLDNTDPNGFTYTGTSSYFVIDARTRYRLTDLCTVSLGIDNLNNQTYWAFHPYTQRSYSAEISVDF